MKSVVLAFVSLRLAVVATTLPADPAPSIDSVAHQAVHQPAAPHAYGKSALRRLEGCFLVDYSYTETKSLRNGYTLDERVYDVNRDKSVKEWIGLQEISPNKLRLQHVLFATDSTGNPIKDSLIRHQAEDWEFDAPYLYEYTGRSRWMVQRLAAQQGVWTRRVTNLDDGLRYQCAARWQTFTGYPEWTCGNYAPIPGRETRDMERKDYEGLERGTRIVVYGDSWVERQLNTKVIDRDTIVREPLATEVGRNWYVRLPDKECDAARLYAVDSAPLWELLRVTWEEVLDGTRPFVERPAGPPRFIAMNEVLKRYQGQNLSDPEVRRRATADIQKVIARYRLQD